MQQSSKINVMILRLIVVLAAGAGVISLIKACHDSFYFENTTKALNIAAEAKVWAIAGVLLIIIGLIFARLAKSKP